MWDKWVYNQDYKGVVELNGASLYDYGGSLAPVTILQGITECVCMILMIALILIMRRSEAAAAEKFDDLLQTAQDYSIRVSGILPRDPKAYKTFFDNMLKKHKEIHIENDPMTLTKSKVGVVRVTILYDIDKMMSALQSKILANRAYTAAHLHYSVRDVETTMSVEQQKEGYLKDGKNGKPTLSTKIKTMLGCTQFGYYSKIYNMENANEMLDQSIQQLKKVTLDSNGKFIAEIDENTKCQEEDPEILQYRLPIFAFVTFNTEAQQNVIKEVFDNRDKGLWQTLFKEGACCGKASYPLTLLREHFQNTDSAYLVHPLPSDTPENVVQETDSLNQQLLEYCKVVEAPEPSDINWTTQGYLTGKMPLADPDLSWDAPKPGSANKYKNKVCSNIKSYAIAITILIILFMVLLAIETQATSLRKAFNNAYFNQAVGWILAGTVTLINLALPVRYFYFFHFMQIARPYCYLFLFLFPNSL
jgi:hypothetical protein